MEKKKHSKKVIEVRNHRDCTSIQQKTRVYLHLISIILLSTLEIDMAANPWMCSCTQKKQDGKNFYHLLLSNYIIK